MSHLVLNVHGFLEVDCALVSVSTLANVPPWFFQNQLLLRPLSVADTV